MAVSPLSGFSYPQPPAIGQLSAYATPAPVAGPFQAPGIGPETGYQAPKLGELLQSQGVANLNDIAMALNASQQSGQPLGQSLLQSGKIDPQTLNQALTYQQDQRILQQALQLVGQIRNLPADEAYMRHLGINPVFRSGQDAIATIQQKGARVVFGDMGDSPAHAQWIPEQNLIMINQRYRGDLSKPTLYAISEAIYHEAGHASGNGDGESSIQEELDCLALNTLAHRYHEVSDPAYAQAASTSRLISDGVALYAKLFFDPDPQKQALVNRVVEKYGDLPMWSPGHMVPPPGGFDGRSPLPMAYRVAQAVDARNVSQGAAPASPSLGQVPAGLPPAPAPVSMSYPPAPVQANPFAFSTPMAPPPAPAVMPGQQFNQAA